MVRVLCLLLPLFGTLFGAVLPAQSAPFATLTQPSQTAHLEQEGVHLMAFYNRRDAVLDLTVLITDPDGEALRTRIALRDRQHHTLLLDAEMDYKPATRIEFMRTGDRIEMIFSDTADRIEFSADRTRQSF